MVCEVCGSENVDWGSYCAQCGSSLGWICRCSFANQPGDQYCGGCGKPLSKEGENKGKKTSIEVNASTTYYQFTDQELKKLIEESILLKVDKNEDLSQGDIDNIFHNE